MKIIKHFLYFSLLLLFFLVGLVLYWSFYPYKVIEFQTPYKVLSPVVKVGGTLEYEVSYCKNMDLPGELYRSFNDGIVYSTEPIHSNVEAGCHSRVVSIKIPETLLPSKYYIRATYVYNVNPIRRVTYTNETEMFEIVE